jgi:hypothetical protein
VFDGILKFEKFLATTIFGDSHLLASCLARAAAYRSMTAQFPITSG